LREGHQNLRAELNAVQADAGAMQAHIEKIELQAQRDVAAARQAAEQAMAKAAVANKGAGAGPVAAPGVPQAEMQKMQQQLFSANARMAAQAKEMDGLRAQITELEEQLTAPNGAGAAKMPNVGTPANDPEMDAKIAGAITTLAGRLETIVKRLQVA
jgi:hypothetical protein